MSDEITADDLKDPWGWVFLAALLLGAAAIIFFPYIDGTLARYPERSALHQAQGTIIDIERVRGGSVRLRLSDSERWYAPIRENDLHAQLRKLNRAAVVTVLHAAEPASPPRDGSRWYVTAYALSIDGVEVFTYDAGRAAHDNHQNTEFWLGVFFSTFGAISVGAAIVTFRNRPAGAERDPFPGKT